MRHPFVLREGCISTIPLTPDDGPNDVLPLFSLLLRPGFSKPRPVNRIAARYTSSDDSFSAAFRPVHLPPPPLPPSSATTFFVSHLFLLPLPPPFLLPPHPHARTTVVRVLYHIMYGRALVHVSMAYVYVRTRYSRYVYTG